MIVVLDIDGTLTRSRAADATAFAAAFAATFGVPLPDTDWSSYVHATSAGILDEALARCRGAGPSPAEREAMQAAFATELDRSLAEPATLAVPGAATVFERLRAVGYRVAIATGGWGWEGERKLRRAGIARRGVPLASSDDHPDRTILLRLALARAGRSPDEPAVYVGDGAWDLRAARSLGLGFVGVDLDGDGRLAALGCACVVPDLRELERTVAGRPDRTRTRVPSPGLG
jgi:phosphoglycolate phosphatase-like HAD superfamily hydrolase